MELRGFRVETEKPRTFAGDTLDIARTHVMVPHNGDASLRETVEHDGLEIPRYVAEISALFRQAEHNGTPMATLAGLTGNGVITIPPKLQGKVEGFTMPIIDNPVDLKRIAKIQMDKENPVAITVPASATIQAINALLAEEWPDRQVHFDITTDKASQIGGNFVTGALGDSREALHVLEALIVDGDGTVRRVTAPRELDAYRGTQGAAGTVTELTLKIEKVPPRREYVLVPLVGSTPSDAYLKNYSDIAAALYEFMHFREGSDVWIDGADILDRSGLERIIEVEKSHGTKTEWRTMAEAKLAEWGDQVHGLVMLNVRHAGKGTLTECFNKETPDTPLGRFMEQLTQIIPTNEAAQQFAILDSTRDIERIRALRESVPERGREEAEAMNSNGKKLHYSKSMDLDVVLDLDMNGIELTNVAAIDALRDNVRTAFAHILTSTIDTFEKARKEGGTVRAFLNGHLLGVSREKRPGRDIDPYFDGGMNVHLRITGEKETDDETVDALWLELHEQLLVLHGEPFSERLRTVVHEGEKHNPKDIEALQHGEFHEPEIIAARKKIIRERSGKTLGWRSGSQSFTAAQNESTRAVA